MNGGRLYAYDLFLGIWAKETVFDHMGLEIESIEKSPLMTGVGQVILLETEVFYNE